MAGTWYGHPSQRRDLREKSRRRRQEPDVVSRVWTAGEWVALVSS